MKLKSLNDIIQNFYQCCLLAIQRAKTIRKQFSHLRSVCSIEKLLKSYWGHGWGLVRGCCTVQARVAGHQDQRGSGSYVHSTPLCFHFSPANACKQWATPKSIQRVQSSEMRVLEIWNINGELAPNSFTNIFEHFNRFLWKKNHWEH